jgi:hypothetical protein
MSTRRRQQPLTIHERRERQIQRKYRQFSDKAWKNERYFQSIPSGLIPTDRKTRGFLTGKQTAIGLHYENYLQHPKVRPNTSSYVNVTPMGTFADELMFVINIHPLYFASMQSTPEGSNMLHKITQEMNLVYRRVALHVQTEFIGDPRPFGASNKGLIPRGGTGYLRQMSRNNIEAQISRNRDFPYSMSFGIPVEYVKVVNQMLTSSLAHNSSYGWRIVDYTPVGAKLKRKYKRVKLHDPSAVTNFFEEIIKRTREYTSQEMKRYINRTTLSLKPMGYTDIFGNVIKVDRDLFLFDPPEFDLLMRSP